jgi:hypothetical protein
MARGLAEVTRTHGRVSSSAQRIRRNRS